MLGDEEKSPNISKKKKHRKDASRERGRLGERGQKQKGKTRRKKETSSKYITLERWHLLTIQFSTTHTQTRTHTLVFAPCVCVCPEAFNGPCAGLRAWAGTG